MLNTPIHLRETIHLTKNENGEFFEGTGVPYACTKQPLEELYFYNAKDGEGLLFFPCDSSIWVNITNEESANVKYLHAYTLLSGTLFFDEYDRWMEFNLPEEAAKELAEIWDANLYGEDYQ